MEVEILLDCGIKVLFDVCLEACEKYLDFNKHLESFFLYIAKAPLHDELKSRLIPYVVRCGFF